MTNPTQFKVDPLTRVARIWARVDKYDATTKRTKKRLQGVEKKSRQFKMGGKGRPQPRGK